MMHTRSSRDKKKQKILIEKYLVCHSGQQGSALIVTLLLISILVTLVTQFIYDAYVDTSSLNNWSAAQRASFIAKSGQNLSTELISEISSRSYTYERSVIIPVLRDFGSDAHLSVTVEDENAKLNINAIATDEKALSSLKKLLEFLNINPDLSLVIADWIDSDREPRLSNSEDNAKNTFLWSVNELKSINDINQSTVDVLKQYVTVHGNNQVNINSAELPVLISLSPDMTEDLAQRIIYYRESTPFEDKSYVQRVSGFEAIGIQIIDRITVKASTFRITAHATVRDISRMIESVVGSDRKVHFWREV